MGQHETQHNRIIRPEHWSIMIASQEAPRGRINMSELSKQNDIHTKECRIAVTKMVLKLFDLWQISIADQAILLNRSLRTLRRYQKGGCYADNEDMLKRVGYLLSIHKYLRSLYPYNSDLVYRWVSSQNKAFDGHTPIEVMKKGVDGIIMIRSYLGHQMYG
ncbi:MAG: DUF2384 domain-containing protein [Chlorobium sp.]|nr:DUF2384 domain-containing protein [Chlorobium sp.]